MSKRFKKRKKASGSRKSYNYKPTDSMRQEERKAYQRFVLTFILIIALTAGLYFWGVDLVIGVSNFWREVFSNGQINTPMINKQTGPLLPPRLENLPLRTNQEKIKITGWTQPGLEARIIANEEPIAMVLADKAGRFEYGSVELREGKNEISAVTVREDRESEPSNTHTVHLDTQKPDLTVEVGQITDDAKVTVSGNTEASAVVRVNNHIAPLDADSNYSVELELNKGENEIKVTAQDRAGNKTQKTKTIIYTSQDSSKEVDKEDSAE